MPEAMARNLDDGLGLIHAEALSFALSDVMARPEAQSALKALCREAQVSQTPLAELVKRDFPDVEAERIFDPAQQMGTAENDARAFVTAARSLSGPE